MFLVFGLTRCRSNTMLEPGLFSRGVLALETAPRFLVPPSSDQHLPSGNQDVSSPVFGGGGGSLVYGAFIRIPDTYETQHARHMTRRSSGEHSYRRYMAPRSSTTRLLPSSLKEKEAGHINRTKFISMYGLHDPNHHARRPTNKSKTTHPLLHLETSYAAINSGI